jgi:hypothetical protein
LPEDIFRIDDGEIDLVLLFEILKTIEQGRAPGLTNNITNEQEFHRT